MKKNVFSRTMAVLASMTVLGAASMMSASAAGVKGDDVTVEPGTTSVKVDFYMDGVSSNGAELTFKGTGPLTVTKASGTSASSLDEDGLATVYAVGEAYATDEPFTTLTVEIAADAEPGTYPIEVTFTKLDDGGSPLANPVQVGGSVTIAGEEPEETTEAPATTAAATEAATTTTTTAKKKASPKTGVAGVGVAVAGLVTAGATAVVLKKKH